MAKMSDRLILASSSAARATLLRTAGLVFEVRPPFVDETRVKAAARSSGCDAIATAQTLAQEKSKVVSRRHPGAVVIGGDQILTVDDRWLDKPCDVEQARSQLLLLRGRAHELATAACVMRDGIPLWQNESVPRLTMRPFSEAFLDNYLREEGDSLLACVGAYRLEGQGVQLFDSISGDYFAILGLPLLPLLAFLRRCAVIST